MATADDRPNEEFANLEPEDRPARRRRDGGDAPHYEEPHRGVLILVLGIIGLVACQPLGIAAWIMGSGDLKKMDEGVMDPEGRSNTQVGKILGMVATILMAVSMIFMLLWFAGMALFIGMAANAPKPPPPAIQQGQGPVNNPAPR